MSDRIFASVLALVTLAYLWIAATAIKAPFQYDPLGPESWPRLLAVVMLACLALLLWRPDRAPFDVTGSAWSRLCAAVVLLGAYAFLFKPLGFILATFAFSLLSSRMLGARWPSAVLFGIGMGVGGYLLCAGLLDLNLPDGPLPGF